MNKNISKIKCLLVTPHFFPMYGGALTVYDALATYAKGQIEILTATTNYIDGSDILGWQDEDAKRGYPIHRIQAMRAPRDTGLPTNPINYITKIIKDLQLRRRVLRVVLDKLIETEAHILCVGSLDSLGWLVAAVKKALPIQVVTYVHGEEVSQDAYAPHAEARRQRALHASDGIITVSHFTAGILQEKYGISPQKIECILNGVDLNKFNYNNIIEENINLLHLDKNYIFSCGRLVRRKGFDKLLRAWPLVLAEVPDTHLIIGGDGPLKEYLAEQVTVLNVCKSVTLVGWVCDKDLPAYYAHAKLFVMPNRTMDDGDTEGFGLVLLEAAAMGVPAVAGRAGGTADAVLAGNTGLLVDGNEPQEIAAALIKLLKDNDLRTQMAENALRHATTQGWPDKTQQFLKYLDTLIHVEK